MKVNKESKIIQLRSVEEEVKKAEEINKKVIKINRIYTKEINSLRKEIKIRKKSDSVKIVDELSLKYKDEVSDMFKYVFELSNKSAEKILGWDGSLDIKNTRLSSNQLKSLAYELEVDGNVIDANIDRAFAGNAKKIITESRLSGESISALSQKLYNELGSIVSKRNVETVARTYAAKAGSTAKKMLYEQNADIINSFAWNSTLENGNFKTGRGTCARCSALDQQEYKEMSDAPDFPLHPRCRCFLVPRTKTWKELGFDVKEMDNKYRRWAERLEDRRKLDYGTTDESFPDWWKSKGKVWQDNSIVGPTRAKLIRSGAIEYTDIVDRSTGDLLTIDQLKKKFKIK